MLLEDILIFSSVGFVQYVWVQRKERKHTNIYNNHKHFSVSCKKVIVLFLIFLLYEAHCLSCLLCNICTKTPRPALLKMKKERSRKRGEKKEAGRVWTVLSQSSWQRPSVLDYGVETLIATMKLMCFSQGFAVHITGSKTLEGRILKQVRKRKYLSICCYFFADDQQIRISTW